MTKGRAKAIEKPNMPIAGPKRSPFAAASTNNVPMMGPVHEKETNAKLKDMKNNPMRPPLSDFASILLTNELGSWISNAPKKEAAKTTKSKKNKKLNIPLVLSSFKAVEPKIMVTNMPNRSEERRVGKECVSRRGRS